MNWIGKLLTGAAVALVLISCATIQPKSDAERVPTSCAANVDFEMETSKAKLTTFKCYIQPFSGKEVLWYEFGLKNVSDKPARFVVRVIPEEGPSFSGLIPATGKPKDFPVMGPGEEQVNKFAMNTIVKIPRRLTVIVEEDLK